MTKTLTLRQVLFAYMLMMLSPILRHLPNYLTKVAGASGYLSVIVGAAAALVIAFCVYGLIKSFPAMNIYEMLESSFTVIGAKIIIFLYFIWVFFSLTMKSRFYAVTCQTTLISNAGNSTLYTIMLLLVGYTIYKGIKSVFRMSELLLTMFLIIIILLAVICMKDFDVLNLLPISVDNIMPVIKASPCSFNVMGVIIIALFFADRFDRYKSSPKPYVISVMTLSVLSLLISVVTVGTNGAKFTSKLVFPFYGVVRRSAFLNILERLEPFVIIPSVVSDFVFICVFTEIALLCIKWLFGLDDSKFLAIPLFVMLFFFALLFMKTQFESEHFYYSILLYLNPIFLYVIPVLLTVIALIKKRFSEKTAAQVV